MVVCNCHLFTQISDKHLKNNQMKQEQKLLPRMAVSYWDIKFQMQRQADKIKKDYPRFQVFKPKQP